MLKGNKILLAITLLLIVASVFYIFGGLCARYRFVSRFEEKYGKTGQGDTAHINLYRVPGYHRLIKEEGRLRCMSRMAESDSVCLFLDLSGREAQLMIKGVGVRTIPLQNIKTDALFRKASDEALYNWLSEPLQIVADLASIPKEPVNVVMAPKDSSDEIPALVPDTLQKDPVLFIFETDRDLRLYFYQTDSGNSWDIFSFNWLYRWRNAGENMASFVTFRIPDYTPVLFIGLSKEDARVIYRAIPDRGQIGITL